MEAWGVAMGEEFFGKPTDLLPENRQISQQKLICRSKKLICRQSQSQGQGQLISAWRKQRNFAAKQRKFAAKQRNFAAKNDLSQQKLDLSSNFAAKSGLKLANAFLFSLALSSPCHCVCVESLG